MFIKGRHEKKCNLSQKNTKIYLRWADCQAYYFLSFMETFLFCVFSAMY